MHFNLKDMPKYFYFLLFIISILFLSRNDIYAQPPQKMSYQAVVRNAQNSLVVNQAVGVKVSIRQHSAAGPIIFIETHTTTTNSNGLMTIEIGTGMPQLTTPFSDIPWSQSDFFLQTDIDITGGTNYTILGVQQLLSVPYAFFAAEAAYADSADYYHLTNRPEGNNPGDILYWDGSDWTIIPAGSEGQFLTMGNNQIPTWITPGGNLGTMPSIRTDSVYDITGRTAYVRATILDAGSTGIIASGICWSQTPFPSIGNSHTTDGTSIGTFVSIATNLTSGATFYARAYATNAGGTAYGAPISFTTPTHCGNVVDYDGNIYNTVYIGAQCWMQENLKTKHYSNGAAISQGYGGAYNDKYYFRYGNSDDNMNKFGLLYTWEAVMNGAGSSDNNPSGIQGICPSGWHVPSNSEWCELENYIEPGIDVTCSSTGYRGSMAKKLTKPEEWTSYSFNMFAPGYWQIDTTGFNTSGFSALPGGYYYYSSPYFYNLNKEAHFWTSTSGTRFRYFSYNESGVGHSTRSNRYALSVRCVKN